MEFYSIVFKFCVWVYGLWVVVFIPNASAEFTNSVIGLEKECEFPAIFNFGDSNSDTGGLSAAFRPTHPPYGETYFHTPVGRYSDGRLIIDFIAKGLNLPFISAYLDSLGTNFSHGANFATASATIRLPARIIPRGDYSPFFLHVQFSQFLQFKFRSQAIRQKGGIYAKVMPKDEYFRKGLYTVDIGANDLVEGFFSNLTLQQVNASVPDMISQFSANLKKIYNLGGGRSFWVHNTGPIGCIPMILESFVTEKDSVGCAKVCNEVAQYFNYMLKETVVQLRKDLPLAAITYVDIYSVKYSLFQDPVKYGFEQPLVACCGYGGKYNFNATALCGSSVNVNGTRIFVGSCKYPLKRVSWDGIHYTEAANKFVFDQISTGVFSDPPVSFTKACFRTNTTANYSII